MQLKRKNNTLCLVLLYSFLYILFQAHHQRCMWCTSACAIGYVVTFIVNAAASMAASQW